MKSKNIAIPNISEKPFKDVKIDHWAGPYIKLAVESGLVLGYPDGTFKPKKNLTRAEGITILTRFAKIEAARITKALPFPDLTKDYWATKYIRKAKAVGMLKYLEKQNFDPKTIFTRDEATEVLYRTPVIQKRVKAAWENGIIFSKDTLPLETIIPKIKTIEPSHEADTAVPTKITSIESRPEF